jgi:hypothetical protein
VAYTISNIYTKLNRTFNFKINKLISKLKMFKGLNIFLFLIKFKLAKHLHLYNNLISLRIKSKFLFCISFSRFKKFFCNLNKLQKNFLKRETKKKFIKKWLKEKFTFNTNFIRMFSHLIIYYCFLLIIVSKDIFFINFILFL